jgi:hypothetical protein
MTGKSTIFSCIALVVLCISDASAQGTASWAAGFPKTGTNAGEIDIKGTITADAGWMVTGAQWEAWEDGKVVFTGVPLLIAGTFDTAIGLTAGKTYNVVVTGTVSNGTITKNVRTPPKTATAKP